MEKLRKLPGNGVWPVVLIVGVAARIMVATLGHNYDMESWWQVAGIVQHGGNVYEETSRYNYGPVWFCILGGLDLLAGHHLQVLRYLVPAFLSLVDVGIFVLLSAQAGRLAGVLFFLNPISILISGYHGQFDNLAILLGLMGVRLLGDDFANPVNRRKMLGLVALGLSLMTKHLFFAFPFWLAVKQKGLAQKLIVLLVPVACFLAGFTPFWPGGGKAIVANVFQYVPAQSHFFYNLFVPEFIQMFYDADGVWYVLLILFAFLCRRRGAFESALIYTGVLVAFSAATANQYLAIPIALTAVHPSWLFFAYTMVGTIHILADRSGPGVLHLGTSHFNRIAIICLIGGLVWLLWRKPIERLARASLREIKLQLPHSKQHG